MKERLVSVIAEVINNEGGAPGHNLHSWRCEYPDSYGDGPCDCVEVIAAMIVERLEQLVTEMKNEAAQAAAKENLDTIVEEGKRLPPEAKVVFEEEEVPFVAIGNGEAAPWEHLPLTCPTCGAENLPLQQSEPPFLQFISHCGGTWVRGPLVG